MIRSKRSIHGGFGLLLLLAATSSARTQDAGAMPGMKAPARKAEISRTLTVTAAGRATTFSAADLLKMPQITVSVLNAHNKREESYAGVRVTELLSRVGLGKPQAGTPMKDSPMLRSYVRATGTDHYWVIYSGNELEPEAHAGEVIVALAMGGKDLGEDGQFKLVSTEDKEPARWVHNLAAIAVVEVK